MNKCGNRGQVALEFAVLIAVAIAAILAMKIYMQRSIQGRLRESVDELGIQFSPSQASFSRTTTTEPSSTQEFYGLTEAFVSSPGATASRVLSTGNTTTSTSWTIPTDLTESMF